MKTAIKHTLVLIALFASTLVAEAQFKVGNNPTSVNPGSLIEMESTNKGLLMPRISLTNTTTWGLLGTPAAGMHVYNTNAGITSSNTSYPTLAAKIGEYYWDGTGWVALAPVGVQDAPVLFSVTNSGTQIFNQPTASFVTTKVNFGTTNFDKNNTFNLSTDSFTIPANGTGVYQLSAVYFSTNKGYAQGAYILIYVNGVFNRYLAISNSAVGAGIAGSGTILTPFNAGDVVDLRLQTSLLAGQSIDSFYFNMSVGFISK